jgi:phosphoribosylaminoimidazole-succinocarboxamide synthase
MTSTTSKTPCITCGKGTGLFKCEGCTQTFCTKHVVEHRKTLHHQLDEIIVEHDTLHQTIIENKGQNHPLIIFIDEWEQKSIKTIQQIAQETRQKVEELANIHTSKFSN